VAGGGGANEEVFTDDHWCVCVCVCVCVGVCVCGCVFPSTVSMKF